MKVKKIMTRDVDSVSPNENLASAVGIMWRRDCGVVPVINEENAVIGMITDRDISIAVTSRNQTASEITVGEVMTPKPVSCSKSDNLKLVLKKMRKCRIKRLPVVNECGSLEGIVSIADVLRLTKKKSLKKQALKTLEAICKPEAILLKEVA